MHLIVDKYRAINWLNMVERLLRDLAAIEVYVDDRNEPPKPFMWPASASDIVEKVKRARKALVDVQIW